MTCDIDYSNHDLNRVALNQIKELIDEVETQEAIFWGKELVVSYRFPSGFTILGRVTCVDSANSSIEIGRRIAREDVESYLLQNKLYESGLLTK